MRTGGGYRAVGAEPERGLRRPRLHLRDSRPTRTRSTSTASRSSENPTWGGWGGRFAPNATGWIDTEDDFPFIEPGGLGNYLTPDRAYPLTRWFVDLQHDFASRVARGVADRYRNATTRRSSAWRRDVTAAPGQAPGWLRSRSTRTATA